MSILFIPREYKHYQDDFKTDTQLSPLELACSIRPCSSSIPLYVF